MKISTSIALGLLCSSFLTPVFAADQAAQEETTPPAAEGPIKTDQIPMVSGMENNKPAAPSSMPQATPVPPPAASDPATLPPTMDSQITAPQ